MYRVSVHITVSGWQSVPTCIKYVRNDEMLLSQEGIMQFNVIVLLHFKLFSLDSQCNLYFSRGWCSQPWIRSVTLQHNWKDFSCYTISSDSWSVWSCFINLQHLYFWLHILSTVVKHRHLFGLHFRWIDRNTPSGNNCMPFVSSLGHELVILTADTEKKMNINYFWCI